jgi:hypothetical protein
MRAGAWSLFRDPGRRRIHWPASEDSFIPLGDAALEVLLSEDTIEAAAIKLTQVSR